MMAPDFARQFPGSGGGANGVGRVRVGADPEFPRSSSMPAPKTLAATREIVIPRLPCRESPAVDIELQLVVRGVVAVKAEFVRAGNAAVVGFAEVRVLGHDRVPVATRNVQDFQADRDVDYRFVAEHRVMADTDEIVAELRCVPLVTAVQSR